MCQRGRTFKAAKPVFSGCHAVIACSSRMETVYGDTDFDVFAAQVPSPLFQRTATAYGDAAFDLFAAQVPSPLFQRTATAYLGVLASRDNAASDVLDASALESPRMPPVRRITGQVRRYHSRVIMSSSGSSSSLLTESSLNDDACGICGDEHGDMMYCEGGGGYSCTAAVHAKCLRSRQVCCMIQRHSYSHLFSELGERSKASGDAHCVKLQERRSYFSVRTTACESKMRQAVTA
jgi:hypothetical protein